MLMVYVPEDMLLWDFWLAPRRVGSGDPYHLFYLQAPRDLPDAELRHERATIGHAVSDDLITWDSRGTALMAGPEGSWDDLATWTGCVVEHDGTWYLFYTGRGRQDRTQRIGVATTTDPSLSAWKRGEDNPIVVADPRFYERPDPVNWADGQACRDPWVSYEPEEDAWYMFFTARANHGPIDERGVIGLARSTDLLHWDQLPPASEPGEFGHLEVPQPVQIGDEWYLFFCTNLHSSQRANRVPDDATWAGTHYLVADDLVGPYRLTHDEPLVGDGPGTFYAGRVVEDPTGQLVFLAWRSRDDEGRFLGGLSNPASITQHPDGRLTVDATALWPGWEQLSAGASPIDTGTAGSVSPDEASPGAGPPAAELPVPVSTDSVD
ncbi:MAG: family 43 glycosylhydrolase [Thermomicrobiales bacterium]